MVRRLVIIVFIAVSRAVAAQELAEFAPANLTLTKRLLVRHKITDIAFLKKDRGVVALALPPAALLWSAHRAASDSPAAESPWTFASRTPIDIDPQAVRALLDTKTSPVPEADLQRAFDELKLRREQVRVRYIFVPRAPPKMSPRNAARHIEKFRRDQGRGVPFETLAAQYSLHASASHGGDLGFIGRGVLPAEAESFAFSAAPAQISRVIETSDGLHVVRIEERRTPTFESLRAELEDVWLSERLSFQSSRQVVAIAANARRIAVASGYLVVLYDLSDSTNEVAPVHAFIEPRPVDAIALTSGGNVVAVATAGEVSIRRLKQGGLRERITGTGAIGSLLFSPNASHLAVVRERGVDIAAVSDRSIIATVTTSDLSAVAFSLDSRTLVTGEHNGRIQLWDATTYDRVRNGEPGYDARYWTERTWVRTGEKTVASAPLCFAFHPLGRLFVAGLRSGILEAFDLATGSRMPLGPATPHNGPLIRATFSDDGKVLVTAAEDDTIGVWGLPSEFERGPKPRLRTFDELVAQHREVVRVHAEFGAKKEELIRLQGEYDNQARYLREKINRLTTQHNAPHWRAIERLPEGNAWLRGLQQAMGYRDELHTAIEVLRLSMIDLEDMARFQVMEINARRVLEPEQFERFAAKLAELTAKVPSRPDPTVAPKRIPPFDRVWQYILTGDLKGTS